MYVYVYIIYMFYFLKPVSAPLLVGYTLPFLVNHSDVDAKVL